MMDKSNILPRFLLYIIATMEEKILQMMFKGERLEAMKSITSSDFDWSQATCNFSREGLNAFMEAQGLDVQERSFLMLYLLGFVVKRHSSMDMEAQTTLWKMYHELQQSRCTPF